MLSTILRKFSESCIEKHKTLKAPNKLLTVLFPSTSSVEATKIVTEADSSAKYVNSLGPNDSNCQVIVPRNRSY